MKRQHNKTKSYNLDNQSPYTTQPKTPPKDLSFIVVKKIQIKPLHNTTNKLQHTRLNDTSSLIQSPPRKTYREIYQKMNQKIQRALTQQRQSFFNRRFAQTYYGAGGNQKKQTAYLRRKRSKTVYEQSQSRSQNNKLKSQFSGILSIHKLDSIPKKQQQIKPKIFNSENYHHNKKEYLYRSLQKKKSIASKPPLGIKSDSYNTTIRLSRSLMSLDGTSLHLNTYAKAQQRFLSAWQAPPSD